MEDKIRNDILDVLVKSLNAVRNEDVKEIKEQSNHVLHNASVYQDKYSILVAVMIYSISKVIERVEQKEQIKIVLSKI